MINFVKSLRTATITANSVPRCNAASNAVLTDSLSRSFQLNNHGTNSKCPLEEIGKNSVNPCTTPRTSACHHDMVMTTLPRMEVTSR